MTTFTTEDRILAEKDGSLTINVNAGEVTASPPHIVDSGASVINNEPVAWQGLTAEEIATIPNDEFRLQKVEKILKERNTHPVKTLTDEEINWLAKAYSTMEGELNAPAFARAILRKAQEK
jgi:HAMP domain-containing protein